MAKVYKGGPDLLEYVWLLRLTTNWVYPVITVFDNLFPFDRSYVMIITEKKINQQKIRSETSFPYCLMSHSYRGFFLQKMKICEISSGFVQLDGPWDAYYSV